MGQVIMPISAVLLLTNQTRHCRLRIPTMP